MARDRRPVRSADGSGFPGNLVTRRTVIAGAGAAIAAVGARALFGPGVAAAGETTDPTLVLDKLWKHTKAQRGSDIVLTAGKDAEARFGRMFKDPPSYAPPDELLQQLAIQMGDPTDP